MAFWDTSREVGPRDTRSVDLRVRISDLGCYTWRLLRGADKMCSREASSIFDLKESSGHDHEIKATHVATIPDV